MGRWLRIVSAIALLLPYFAYSTPPVWAQGDWGLQCPPVCVIPFVTFNPAAVIVNASAFSVSGTFTLPSGSTPKLPGDVSVALGSCGIKDFVCATITIPASSLHEVQPGRFVFSGVLFDTAGPEHFEGFISTGVNGFAFQIGASGVPNLPLITSPTNIYLEVSGGTTIVNGGPALLVYRGVVGSTTVIFFVN